MFVLMPLLCLVSTRLTKMSERLSANQQEPYAYANHVLSQHNTNICLRRKLGSGFKGSQILHRDRLPERKKWLWISWCITKENDVLNVIKYFFFIDQACASKYDQRRAISSKQACSSINRMSSSMSW